MAATSQKHKNIIRETMGNKPATCIDWNRPCYWRFITSPLFIIGVVDIATIDLERKI